MERLTQLLGSAAPGRGRVVLVHGAAGAGHADVVGSLRAASGDAGHLLEGSCAEGAQGPFRPFLQIARAISAGGDPADRDAVAPLLAGPLAGASGLSALLEQVRVRDSRLNHMESVRRALVDVASRREGRTLVVVHDLDAADDDTLALVDYLIADVAPAGGIVGIGAGRSATRPSFVLTVNDDTPAGRVLLARLSERDAVTPLGIGRLDGDGLAAMLREPALAEKLLRVTDGLPNRVRKLVDILPDDLNTLVDARLAGLSADAVGVLRCSHVFGEPLSSGALAVLAGASRLVVQRLRADGYLAEHCGADGEIRVHVAAAWAESDLLEPTDRAERVLLHTRCAEHLEARLAVGGDDELREGIARHRLASGCVDAAVEHALWAARWLASKSAIERGADLLRDVLDAGPSTREPATLALIELEVALGRFDAALNHCSELVSSGDLELVLRTARIHSMRGDLEAAATALERLESVDLPAALRDVADTQLADVRLRRGDLPGAEALCSARLESGVEDPIVALTLQHTLAKVVFWRGDFAGAEAAYRGVLDGLGSVDAGRQARRMRALVLHNLGLVSLREGRYEQAIERIQQGLGILDELGEHFEAAVCGHNLALAHEYCQRYSMAIRLFERSIEVLERFGNRVNLTGAVNSLGDLYLTIGETWRARKLIEYSLSLARDNGLDYFVAFNRVRLASLDQADGRAAAGLAQAELAIEAFTASGHAEELAEARIARARCLVGLGDSVGALAGLDEAEAEASVENAARAQVLRASIVRLDDPTGAHTMALGASRVLLGLGQRDGVVAALTEAALAARAGGQRDEARRLTEEARRALGEWRSRVPSDHHEAFDELAVVTALSAADETTAEPAPAAPRKRRAAPSQRDRFHGMIGSSPAMRRAFGMIERLSDCDAPILILGESGTGKELVAEAICAESNRVGRPFVRVNAAAFADTLLESELFGHEKGAFTGAVARKLGAFEQADGGTLFLDEIGDISPKTQVSLLRVLQEREFRRVGGRKPIKVDVRILCATNRNLEQMVADGTFRLDLYYRVKGLTLELPPLRDRGADLEKIADAILSGLAEKHGRTLRLADDATALLTRYRWPGNVRELENVLRSVYFFAQGEAITAEELTSYTLLRDARPQDMTSGGGPGSAAADDGPIEEGFDLNEAKRELEIRCIRKAMEQTGGNITQAARLLGMKRPRLSQKIKEYRLKVR